MPPLIPLLALALLFSTGSVAQESPPGESPGETEAWALAAGLLQTLGGSRPWAEARSVRVELRGFYALEHRPWVETFWLDLEQPRGRFELRGGDEDRTIAWTSSGGWELRRGQVKTMPKDRHQLEMEYWRRQPLVLFHHLAQGAVEVRVAEGDGGNHLEVVTPETGELLARLRLNLEHEPIRWSSPLGERELEHVLGPLGSFGGVRFPRWGANVGGTWRYEHLSVDVSPAPLDVPLAPPASSQGEGTG